MASANGQPAYTVTLLHPVGERLADWGRLADRIGFGEEYRQALRDVDDHLTYDPMEWGDPLHDHHHAGLSERWFMHPVLIVYYGVHEASRQVFVRDVRLNPYSRLAREGLQE